METFITLSDGVKLCCRKMGEGKKPLVFLHGWGGTQLSFDASIKALTGDYMVISYDHRGFGDSDRPDQGYSVERLAEDLRELLEQMGLSDVVLVGWSMGGVVAAEYLRTYGSARVSHLVLVDVNVRILCDETYSHGFYDGAYTAEQALRDVTLMARNFRLFVQEMPEKANMTLYDQPMREIFIDKVVEQNPKPYPPLAMWLSLCHQDLTETFRGLDIPVLFCHGGTSTYCPPLACKHVMSLFRNGTLREFPECSHFICIERPTAFSAAIDDFLSASRGDK